jgi:GH25 family lysozyme M1 (1,4-beta-N-acetylmuramidase)
MTIPFLDLSSVQKRLTPQDSKVLLARGVRGIICKCENGNSDQDPNCATDIKTARDTGLIVGIYHFPFALPDDPHHPNRNPIDQARLHFGYTVDLAQVGDLVDTVDIEWPRPEQWDKPIPNVDNSVVSQGFLHDWFDTYLDEYRILRGRDPMIYFDEWFMRHLAPGPSWAVNPAWIASYGKPPPPIFPWAGYCAWQTSGGGGILPDGQPVDTDVIADEATLDALRLKSLGPGHSLKNVGEPDV